MNGLFKTKNETWKRIQSNLLFIAAAELLIYNGGLMIKYPVSRMIDFFTPVVGEDYALYYNANFWMIIPAYIFSIKASGNPATIGAFQGTLNHANGFFHESFGYEGSITATILATASILWLICRLKRKERQIKCFSAIEPLS